MKVLLLNGSPKGAGNTAAALAEMKSIALGKEQYGLPEREKGKFTNFIR